MNYLGIIIFMDSKEGRYCNYNQLHESEINF